MPPYQSVPLPALVIDVDAASGVFAAERYDDGALWFEKHTTWPTSRVDIVDLVGDVLIVSERRKLYGPELDLQWALCGDADGIDKLMVGFHIAGTSTALMANPIELRILLAEHIEKRGVPLVVGIYASVGQYLSSVLDPLRA